MEKREIEIRAMVIDDYEEVHKLWSQISGFAMRSIDDSYEGINRFLKRNPLTSCVAICDRKIVGAVLCGHDGRQGSFYHVCVDRNYRRLGIGKSMVVYCMNALRKEKINKIALVAFTKNEGGIAFWNSVGWRKREDCVYYDFILNEENIIKYNE